MTTQAEAAQQALEALDLQMVIDCIDHHAKELWRLRAENERLRSLIEQQTYKDPIPRPARTHGESLQDRPQSDKEIPVKPVAWIKVHELTAMKAVAEHSITAWKTNLGLVPEPDDEGLYTETQVQQLRESFEQSVTDPENQPSQYGTVPMDWYDRDTALLRQALEALEASPDEMVEWRQNHWEYKRDLAITALRERLALSDAAKLAPKPGQFKNRGQG